MGVCVGDLEQRQMERLRVELGEVLAAHVAFPPFFNYRAAQSMVRPLDRTKRDEIDQYLRSVNFTPIERAEVTSPEVRRFLERLILRFIEVNPSLSKPRLQRRLPELRSRAPRMAADVQRGLLAFLSGQTTPFGTRRAQPAWSGPAAQPHHLRQEREHNTRVLEAILVRRGSGTLPPPPAARPATPPAPVASVTPAPLAARPWSAAPTDLTVPVPAQEMPSRGPHSPFAGLEVGAQSDVFGAISGAGTISAPDASRSYAAGDSISDSPTGPMVVARPTMSAAAPASVPARHASEPPTPANARDLPQDLFQLYGDYLRDMEPEAEERAPARSADPPKSEQPVVHASGTGEFSPFTANGYGAQSAPSARPTESVGTRSDKLIFWQLRYQLEAYVRRAARSYGVRTSSGDPSGVIDALRQSGFVDEADLRIAEGILASTDRVTAGVAPTIEDYRQVLMLYLLYHRSHLGA